MATNSEKQDAPATEGREYVPEQPQELDPGNPFPATNEEDRAIIEKRLRGKLDLPCSCFVLIYIMNYLDRNNIAAQL
ncbi:hypothetical protein ACJZ2D_008561 [Fusarium nematophilum]